jgi:hypothetical protein
MAALSGPRSSLASLSQVIRPLRLSPAQNETIGRGKFGYRLASEKKVEVSLGISAHT